MAGIYGGRINAPPILFSPPHTPAYDLVTKTQHGSFTFGILQKCMAQSVAQGHLSRGHMKTRLHC